MKFIYLRFFIFVFISCFFVSAAFAIDYIDIHPGCGDRVLKDTFTKVNKGSTEYSACADSVDVFRTEVEALPAFNSSNCVTFGSFSSDCYLLFIDVCCDSAYMANIKNRTDIVTSHNVVTGVPAGGEISVAEAYFTEFKTNAVPPVKDGLVITDVYAGYVYSGNLNSESQLTDVTIDAWKRVGYTGTGVSPIPLDSIASSGGSGGLSSSQTTSAVAAALDAQGLSGAALEAKMKASLDYGHDQGYFNGGTGGGLSQGDTTQAFKDALDVKFPSSTYTGGDGTGLTPYASTKTASDFSGTWSEITDSFNSFKTSAKDTGLYSVIGTFFDSGNFPSPTEVPSVTLDTTKFGNHTFNFDIYSTAFLILKGVILISFGYAAFRVLMLGGRGG